MNEGIATPHVLATWIAEYSQCRVHLVERVLGLIEKVKYYRGAEVVFRRVIHLQDLRKRAQIQGIPHLDERGKLIVLECVSSPKGNTLGGFRVGGERARRMECAHVRD